MESFRWIYKIGISCCAFCAAAVFDAQGQQADSTPIPLDPQVRYGKLDNGLTYYIRRNTYRPQLADFYLAQKVGSILEKPSQRGLAHFLEHMAFNGTTHFPGGEKGLGIVPWCETVGIKFGTNLNAYTSIEQTVYNICDAPVTREGIIDSCLLILHDWSNELLLTDQEIDKERGVIEEEWRTRQNSSMRIYEQVSKKLYKDSKYEDCLPIGNIEVVRHFPYQELRDYYEEWYRPDLQGIIIVGDIDPDQIEQKIKQLFSDIPAQPNASKRIYYPVSDNKEPIVAIATDREEANTQIELYFKHDPIPWNQRETLGAWRRYFENNMISQIIDERMSEITQNPDAPLLESWVGEGTFLFSNTKNAFVIGAAVKENQSAEGLSCLYREIVRAVRCGFTDSEVERAKQRLYSGYENLYNEREHTLNDNYVQSYINHFLFRNVTPGIEYEYTELIQKVIPQITATELQSLLKQYITPDNRVILLTGPEKNGVTYPTEQNLLDSLAQVDAEQLTPYVDKIGNEPLLQQLPQAGKIVEQEPDSFGFTHLKLSNGMNVYVKSTDFSMDEIQFRMTRDGGTSLFPESDINNWGFATEIVQEGGIGNYSKQQLRLKLAGKRVGYAAFANTYENGISGACAVKDFETLMQLVYLQFTAPRKDEEAMQVWKNSKKEAIRNENLQPATAFSDSMYHTIYLPSPRIKRFTETEIDSIDYDRVLEYFHELFSDASDFNVFLIGNLQPDSIRPLLEQYLAALPSDYTEETWQPTSVEWRKGERINHFQRKQETPKSYIMVAYNKTWPVNLRNALKIQMLCRLLDITYVQTLREDEGGTYGASVGEISEPIPQPRVGLTIYLTTDQSKQARLLPLIYKAIDDFMQNGPRQEDLDKVKEYLFKQQQQRVRDNAYWLNMIYNLKTVAIDSYTGYEEIVRSITASELRDFARAFFDGSNHSEIIMEPQAAVENAE
ncbi:MAG: M16 family metallopeptidase [Bacteroidaceae bacterium]|jgi:zinc protease